MYSSRKSVAGSAYHKVASLLLVAIVTLTSSISALAAPLALPITLPPQADLAQEESGPDAAATPAAVDAPFGLYLPAAPNFLPSTETLETHVVRLGRAEAQSQEKSEQTGGALSAGDSLLPAPPPGQELYPAQPDSDAATAAAIAPASADAGVTLLQEDFDGTFPTGSWRVLDENGSQYGEYYWDDDDARAFNGADSAWVANGGQNGLDPAFYNYPDNLQSWMIYGPFDLGDAASAQFSFQYLNLSELRYDFLGWYVSPNGVDFYGQRASGDSRGWKPVNINLASVPAYGNMLGDSSVWIAFRFTSDGYRTDRGAFIDQVRVHKETSGSCTGSGEFKAEYFNNKELSGSPLFTRCEKAPINHNWGANGPGNSIGNDNFSIRWTGAADFSNDIFNFVAVSDDGIRVWLDNNLIIDNWQEHALTPNLATRRVSGGKHSLRVEYYENNGGAAAQFRWLRSDTTVTNRQAFDTCFLPSPGEMQNWWGNSPYYEIGIYIGGNNRGCKAHNERYLTASWVSTVRAQGWNMIPTWVGPQAPCTVHDFYTMSSDPGVAFAEGQREAGDAAMAARNLGLTSQDLGGTVIYYDMEPYPNEPGCRAAVKSFMAGWASRLHELGNQAGAYGAACASYVTDWVQEAPYVLDQIWPAAWIYPAYDDDASVWDVSCIDDSLWSNHQRIRQYAGDHNERWGNVTMFIDSNVTDGQVAGRNPRAQVAGTEPPAEPTAGQWSPVQIADLQLLATNEGWAIAQGRLLWSTDGGATWLDRTPTEAGMELRAASFLDPATGWIVGAGQRDAQGRSPLYLGVTQDGGLTWQLQPIPFDPIEPGSTQGAMELDFFDANTGYLQIKLASSSNFDIHVLLKTVDGGMSWQEVTVPGSSPVHFADANHGWTVGKATDAPAQITTDGGATWQAGESIPVAASTSDLYSAQLAAKVELEMGATAAAFLANGKGWIAVQQGVCSGVKPAGASPEEEAIATEQPFDCVQHSALLSTQDGGSSWIDITPAQE